MRPHTVSISTNSSKNFVMKLRYWYAATCTYCKMSQRVPQHSCVIVFKYMQYIITVLICICTYISKILFYLQNIIEHYIYLLKKHKMTDAGNRRFRTTDNRPKQQCKQLHNNQSTSSNRNLNDIL